MQVSDNPARICWFRQLGASARPMPINMPVIRDHHRRQRSCWADAGQPVGVADDSGPITSLPTLKTSHLTHGRCAPPAMVNNPGDVAPTWSPGPPASGNSQKSYVVISSPACSHRNMPVLMIHPPVTAPDRWDDKEPQQHSGQPRSTCAGRTASTSTSVTTAPAAHGGTQRTGTAECTPAVVEPRAKRLLTEERHRGKQPTSRSVVRQYVFAAGIGAVASPMTARPNASASSRITDQVDSPGPGAVVVRRRLAGSRPRSTDVDPQIPRQSCNSQTMKIPCQGPERCRASRAPIPPSTPARSRCDYKQPSAA